MNLLKKIINHFKSNEKYPKNFCMAFDNLADFINYVSGTYDFEHHYIYYYRGEAKNLVALLSHEYSGGEKDIPDMSLEYMSNAKLNKNNNIVFEDAIFFPDQVYDLVGRFYTSDRSKPCVCQYRSDTSGFHQISNYIIAQNNVYLCSK